MALLPFYLRRPAAILKMPEAIARGLTCEGFIRELKGTIGTFRRTVMLADWRSVANIEAKKDVIKYVRKDRLPSMRVVADVEWNLSQEYMYKVKVWTQIRPGEPLEESFVNLMSDRLLTPAEVGGQVFAEWPISESRPWVQLERLQVVGIYHRIPSPLEEQ